MDTQELENKIQKEFEDIRKKTKKANILIVGATGAGKSSLINLIFGEELAQAGTGKPVTSQIQKYESPDVPVVIYDSVGAEQGLEDDFRKQAKDLIEQHKQSVENAIHVVWYCIGASSHRVQEFDQTNIRYFTELGVKTAVIFTKGDMISEAKEQELIGALQDFVPEVPEKVPYFVSSITKLDISKHEDLIGWTAEILPEQVKESFISAQRGDLKQKWDCAHKCIVKHGISAAAIGANPIPLPLADAPLLLAVQAKMIANILSIYNLGSLSDYLKETGLGAIAGQLVARLGKSLAGNLLKMIPVVGSFVGGAVNAGVATAMTLAIGEGISLICYKLYNQVLSGNLEAAKDILESFGSQVAELAEESMKEGKKKPEDYQLN